MPPDEQDGASSTPEEINAASDAARESGDVARYNEIENARELAEQTGKAQTVEAPPAPKKEASEKADPDPATEKDIQEKPGPKESKRIKELLDGRVALENENVRLKAELDKKPGAKADPPPAVEKKVEAPKADTPVKPKLADFTTHAEWDTANDKYVEDLVTFKAGEVVSAREAARATAAAEQSANDAWQTKVAAATEEHADYAEVAFSKTTPITPTMDGFILKQPLGARVLYKLGENGSAEAKRIALLDPYDQVEALLEIKNALTTPEKKTAPVKKHTAAPPPATNLSATNTESPDAEMAALNRGDVETYTRLANAREAKAARGH